MAKNKIHSVLTALPVLMLIIGLGMYYKGEQAQTGGLPIAGESEELAGRFSGLSAVKTGSTVGTHFFWFEVADRKRGARINPEYKAAVSDLKKGDEIRVWLAPTVTGSKTRWVYRVQYQQELILDAPTQ